MQGLARVASLRIDEIKLRLMEVEKTALDYWERTQINPTLITFVVVFCLFFLNLGISAIFHPLPIWALGILMTAQTLLVYVMFTPAHDSTHYIASKRRWLNELILIGCWPIFAGNPLLFRRIHLIHHAKTNDPAHDPDHFTAADSLIERWIRSMLLMPYYHWYSFKRFRQSWKDYLHTVISLAIPVFIILLGLVTARMDVALWTWLMPAYLGLGILSFTNTAWPHHPGKTAARFLNTRILFVPKLLQFLMMNQNLHLIHHIKPNLPWYKYPEFWAQNAQKLLAEGAKVTYFTKRKDPHSL